MMSEAQVSVFKTWDLGYTVIFSFDVLIQFFVEYSYPSSDKIEKNFFKVAIIYLNSSFIFDLIAIVPFYRLLNEVLSFCRLFYFVKLIRLYRGL